jgi:hypothetical protein
MRYIPQSKYSFDEICEQCRNAVNRVAEVKQDSTDLYTEIRKFYHYDDAYSVRPMKDYGSLIK